MAIHRTEQIHACLISLRAGNSNALEQMEGYIGEELHAMVDALLEFQREEEKHHSIAAYFEDLIDQVLEDQLDTIDWHRGYDEICMDLLLCLIPLIDEQHNVPWREDLPQPKGPITFQGNQSELAALGRASFLKLCKQLRERAPDQALALSLKLMGYTIAEIGENMDMSFEQARFIVNKGKRFLAEHI